MFFQALVSNASWILPRLCSITPNSTHPSDPSSHLPGYSSAIPLGSWFLLPSPRFPTACL